LLLSTTDMVFSGEDRCVLGIETSCDETGLALYSSRRGLLAHALHSQVALHARYGGVVPELASRDHVRRLLPLLDTVLERARMPAQAIDAVAYTKGPGLAGALLVGASFAHALAYALQVPARGIHHLEAHLLSPLMSPPAPAFPFVALLVSGGHSQLMRVSGLAAYQLLGETLDDAAGEAFDKTAKLLGLGYPGGPALAKLAERGTPGRYKLPRPMLGSGDLNMSFSGLKTAVVTIVRGAQLDDQDKADLAAEFEQAVAEVLAGKAISAVRAQAVDALVVAGGVGANARLRATLAAKARSAGIAVYYPPLELCTDNGAMVAFAGAMHLAADAAPAPAAVARAFNVRPRWDLETLR
jgi:N6-L-threonylcarbamoyladenine synthase